MLNKDICRICFRGFYRTKANSLLLNADEFQSNWNFGDVYCYGFEKHDWIGIRHSIRSIPPWCPYVLEHLMVEEKAPC